MPRKTPRAFKLESSASRKKLAVRRKPYWVVVGRNLSLGYRRCRGPGSWSVRGGSRQGEWIRKLADADDLGPAAPPAVLDFWQAVAKAREFVHLEPGEAAVDCAPQSVADALDRYRRHLIAQGGDPGNEQRARHHLGPLLSRPIALLTGRDLVAWRDGLVAGRMSRGNANRLRNAVRAALTAATQGDKTINRAAWEDDFPALPNATKARRSVLQDADVSRLVAAVYRRNYRLGLLMDLLSQTGVRPSQGVRVLVGDLDAANSRVFVPKSAKGHPHKRIEKKTERTPCPIPRGLAAKLAAETRGRPADEPLFRRETGEPWRVACDYQYRDHFAAVVRDCGLPATTVPYDLRHAYIQRALLQGTAVAVVAAQVDSSEGVIRRHYGRFIIDVVSDEHARRALLPELPDDSADNVAALRG